MKTIEIDDDIYTYIAQNTKQIGETASEILRRLLNISHQTSTNAQDDKIPQHELESILEHPRLRSQGSAVNKLLFILGEIYRAKPDEFEAVLEIKGRDRLYFAKTRQEIEDSGSSTQPKQIPGSPYWIMTNTPTRQKHQILQNVLSILCYSQEAMRAAGSVFK